MKSQQNLKKVQALILNNKYEQAEEEISKFLETEPKTIAALHLASLIAIRKNDFEKAKQYAKEALQIDSNSALLLNHLGNIYKHLNDLNQAEYYFKAALSITPQYTEALNNYGLLRYQQKKFTEAAELFTQALKIKPDAIDCMYNLALALKAQEKIEECIAALMAILETDSSHLQSHFLLGQLLLEQKIYEDAFQHFKIIFDENKNNIAVIGSIIHLLLTHDQYPEAKSYCEHYIKLQPDSVEILYNLGIIAMHEENNANAIKYYLDALAIDPDYFPALNNLAVLNLEQNNVETAKYYFQKALAQQPDDESIHHILNAISGNLSAETAPETYIQKLFDSYAEHFEKHLSENLEYCVPQKLKTFIEQNIPIPENPQWNILDLGCGTGLSGEQFKDWAAFLIGVDISPKMVEIAKDKYCYDELAIMGNSKFLANTNKHYDLIIAADVFVYQGDLKPIFFDIHNALKENGFFAFTTEINPKESFTMQSTGRFCHSKDYIKKIAEETGFQIIANDINNTRLQGNQQLNGYYFLLQKNHS